jgi:hypothetical protein
MVTLDGVLIALTVISTLCAVFFGFTAYRRNDKKDLVEDGTKNAVIMSELGYIKASLDDIKRKQETQDEKQDTRHLDVVTRLTAVEASTKQAHKRIDDFALLGRE